MNRKLVVVADEENSGGGNHRVTPLIESDGLMIVQGAINRQSEDLPPCSSRDGGRCQAVRYRPLVPFREKVSFLCSTPPRTWARKPRVVEPGVCKKAKAPASFFALALVPLGQLLAVQGIRIRKCQAPEQ